MNGSSVTPSLDRLARESIVFSNFFSQIGQGTTSDAEFLAGCSQYPLRTGSVFMTHYDGDYRCLPELLREQGYRVVSMHANEPAFWNRADMYRAMGYDRFFSEADFPSEPAIGMGLADGPFFVRAAEHLASLPEPYYALLITLTNHSPFTHRGIPKALDANALGSPLAPYLNSVHYTDASLGEFVEHLRALGVLDRSVLVVYGDHLGVRRDARVGAALRLPLQRGDTWLKFERRVPLLVRLPHGQAAGRREEPAGQIDLTPTIADLLGVPLDGTYFHGRSLWSATEGPVVFPDGLALDGEHTFLAEGGPSGVPLCVDSSGTRVPSERCDALADYAARELSVSRDVVEENLVRGRPRVSTRRSGAARRVAVSSSSTSAAVAAAAHGSPRIRAARAARPHGGSDEQPVPDPHRRGRAQRSARSGGTRCPRRSRTLSPRCTSGGRTGPRSSLRPGAPSPWTPASLRPASISQRRTTSLEITPLSYGSSTKRSGSRPRGARRRPCGQPRRA